MAHELEDRRVRRTKALLRRSLTALMGEKGVKDITVTELTALADVNRGTFYCHYKDVYDMAERLEDEVFAEFQAVMDAYTLEELRGGLRPILRDIFAFVDRNADLCAVFFSAGGDDRFFRRLYGAVYEKVVWEWGRLYGLSENSGGDYSLSFLVQGTLGMVQTWGRKASREEPEKMAILAEQLILRGIEPLKE